MDNQPNQANQASQSNQQPDSSGMTFDSQPVAKDTPVPAPVAPVDSDMTFDAEPVKQDTPASDVVDPMKGASAEERAFLKANPNHQWMPADPKFPNRPAGIYPTGKGNEWRSDPSYTQAPIDLHFAKHTLEGAGYGAAAVAPAVGLAVVPEAATALYDLAIKHLASDVLPDLMTNTGESGADVALRQAHAKLLQLAPKVWQASKVLGGAGLGIEGLRTLWKIAAANAK
jgi:hypothetical protein